MKSFDENKFARHLIICLNIILLMKIAGYFTVSENVGITRILKILLRVGGTMWIIYMYSTLKKFGNIPSVKCANYLVPFFYIAYLALGFLSFLWSTDVGYSALQWVMNVESFLFAYYFVVTIIVLQFYYLHQNFRISSMTANSIFVIMMIFLLGAIINPDDFYRLTHGGEEARLGGYFMNPNELGMLAVVGASTAVMELKHRRIKWPLIIFIIVALINLILTGSRSSLIGFVLTITYFINQSENKKLKFLIYAGMIAAMPLAITSIILKQGDMEEVMSMTGRLPFWKALLSEGLPQEPLTGFGYMRIAYKDYFQSVHTYAGQMTHNTFIQVLMNLGFIGFTFVFLNLITTIRAFLRNKNTEKKKFFVATFIPVFINSLTEFGIYGETNYGILFWQILMFTAIFEFNPVFSLREKLNLKKAAKVFKREYQPEVVLS